MYFSSTQTKLQLKERGYWVETASFEARFFNQIREKVTREALKRCREGLQEMITSIANLDYVTNRHMLNNKQREMTSGLT
jgi:phage tail tape-measure protein